jgi:hypothetical protein
MRWIKLFEGFGRDEYYTELSYDEYNNEIDKINRQEVVEFSKEEVREIGSNLFPKYQVTHLFDLIVINKRDGVKFSRCVTCQKCQDEWYVCRIEMPGLRCYKCDQLEGFLKLLKDKKIIR